MGAKGDKDEASDLMPEKAVEEKAEKGKGKHEWQRGSAWQSKRR